MSSKRPSPAYPVVQLLVVHGKSLSFLLSALILLGVCALGLFTGALWLLPAGLATAGVLLVLLLSYVEVLRIIADTLLPRY